MKFAKIFALIALLSLAVVPALGQLSDYQQGVADGLQAGMTISRLLGAAPYDPSMANQYNNQVNQFNQGLYNIFAGNQTMINRFMLQPYGTAVAATPVYTGKPVHSIDGSWNNTTTILGDQDEGKRIYDMPAAAYYAWTGNYPSYLPYQKDSTVYDNLGGI